MIDIRVQAADFDPGKQLERLANAHPAAVASLTTFVVTPDAVPEGVVDMQFDHAQFLSPYPNEPW